MPPPISRYQPPSNRAGSSPAAFHSRFSRASVPLLSPRDTNAVRAVAMAFSASVASRSPPICAGSAEGPTTIKSFQAISCRVRPWPASMKACSASGSCTSTRSASPCAAVARAWPVPCAITRTSMPVVRVKIGRICRSKPLFSTDVVDASRMVCAHATAGNAASRAKRHRRCITETPVDVANSPRSRTPWR